jgi:DNA helicase HerA-like ATPase
VRRIGIVASGSTVLDADVILSEGEERRVKAEELVLINNRNGNNIMAVTRGGLGSNENLRTSNYSPGVAYARVGRHPSSAKEFYAFGLSVVGEISNNQLKENKMLIAPSSEVSIFEGHDNPMRILGSIKNTIGYYKDHANWKVPANPEYICYHMGVFAATGAGKSLLTRYEIIPFVIKAGYKVLIFDWKGSDYAPHFYYKYELPDIGLEDDIVVDYLSSAMDDFGYFIGSYAERNPIRTALETVIYNGQWRKIEDPEQLRSYLLAEVTAEIGSDCSDSTGKINQYGQRNIRKFEKHLSKLEAEKLRNVQGRATTAEILEALKQHDVVVVDLGLGSKSEKLAIFLSMAKYLNERMEKKEQLDLTLIIDEGPQYCPFMPRGIENKTMEVISELCALGRSYRLAVVLLSQGIAGEIGINAAIRRNLNTQFIGKLNPLDLDEAMRLLGQSDIESKYLVLMPVGDFYVTGKMNASPIPLLIHFDLPEQSSEGDFT